MAKKSQWVQLGKRKLELSNLDKVLFPADAIVKAEVIEYYLAIAPTLLNHIKGRALTLIRFPDGVGGEMFYQKNRPEWAPDWVEFEKLGSEEKKDYIIATEAASIVWLANLAALELHQLHSRRPNFDKPDYMVFDLDPPEGYDFTNLLPIAFALKEHIESFGYTPFVKTTGGKGIHICCPLDATADFPHVFEAAQGIARPFVERFPNDTTLHIKKDARKGRVLIDIYRIRQGQSIVSPYSLRGRDGAPVSMPLKWDELLALKNPKEFNMKNAVEKVVRDGDAWEDIGAYAVELHTLRKKIVPKELPVSRKRKTPAQLDSYDQKRDFSKTPEPSPILEENTANSFVVHRHHASHLHYDLRLSQDGVLKSWAVPRGLPPYPGVKRSAVQTEDHPMKYLTFNGEIPKGQYGGGMMWIYAQGKYQITKEKKDGFYFRLSSKEVNGEYRIHKIKEKEWLMERVDEPQFDFIHHKVEPMLCDSTTEVPAGNDYSFEVKWDGIRALVALEEGNIRIVSRNLNDITKQFPELLHGDKSFRTTCALFDAEIVSLDEVGKPQFKKVLSRLMAKNESAIEKLSKSNPVFCYVFDCLYLDGRSLVNEPLTKRQEWLKDAIRKDGNYRVSETVDDGDSLFAAAKELGLEGIIAKRKDSKYTIGKRSDTWLKIKVRQSADCFIIGYTAGKGNRNATFGALQIAERVGNQLIYRGKVGTGFDDDAMNEISQMLRQHKKTKTPILTGGKIVDEKVTTWIESNIGVEISFAQLTNDKMYREPVFIKLRLEI